MRLLWKEQKNMKPSKHNKTNEQRKAEKRAGKTPLLSRYAAKLRAETEKLRGKQPSASTK